MEQIVESGVQLQDTTASGNVTVVESEKPSKPLFWAPPSEARDPKYVDEAEVARTLISRWTQVAHVDFTSTKAQGSVLTSLDVPACFKSVEFGESQVSSLLKSFQFVRGDTSLRFEVNATRYQTGKLLVCYYYGAQCDLNYKERRDLYIASALPSAIIDIGKSNPVEIDIPYNFPTEYCRTKGNTYYTNVNFARVEVFVLNPLMVGDSVESKCTIAVYAKMTNLKLKGMVPIAPKAAMIAEPQMMSILKGALTGAAEAAFGQFTDNRDYPRDPRPYERVVPTQSNCWSVGTNSRVQMDPLRLDNLGCDPKEGSDEMKIQNIVSKKALLGTFDWTTSHKAGHTLKVFKVHPVQEMTKRKPSEPGKLAMYATTPVGAVASCFSFWRGNLVFGFDLTSSTFHNGRINIAFYPGRKGSKLEVSERHSLHQIIFDLKEHSTFEFEVPFEFDQDFAKVSALRDQEDLWANEIGNIYVTVVNQLVAVDGVADQVPVNVFLSGRNMEFAVPTSTPLGLGWDRDFAVPSGIVEFKAGYGNVYIGEWRFWDGPILRYGAVSDHIAQVKNAEFDVVYTFVDATEISAPDGTRCKFFCCPKIQNEQPRYLIPFSSEANAQAYLASDSVESYGPGSSNEYVNCSKKKLQVQYRYVRPESDIPGNQESCISLSRRTFGEDCSDLKDLLRRFFSYTDDTFMIHATSDYNETVYTLPITPSGLKIKSEDRSNYNLLANLGRNGSMPLLASMFRFFSGGVRMRLVFECSDQNVVFAINHIPDVKMVGHEGISGSHLGRRDAVLSGYAMTTVSMNVNPVAEFEIPNYLPTQKGFLQRDDLSINTNLCDLSGLGNVCISVVGSPSSNVRVNLHAFMALADDSAFDTFCGPPRVVDSREVPFPDQKQLKLQGFRIHLESDGSGTMKIHDTIQRVTVKQGRAYINFGGKDVVTAETPLVTAYGYAKISSEDIMERWSDVEKLIAGGKKISLSYLKTHTVGPEMDVVRGVAGVVAESVVATLPTDIIAHSVSESLPSSAVYALQGATLLGGAYAGMHIARATHPVLESAEKLPRLVEDASLLINQVKEQVPVISRTLDKANQIADSVIGILPGDDWSFARLIYRFFSYAKQMATRIGKLMVYGMDYTYSLIRKVTLLTLRSCLGATDLFLDVISDIMFYLEGRRPAGNSWIKIKRAAEDFWITLVTFWTVNANENFEYPVDAIPSPDFGLASQDLNFGENIEQAYVEANERITHRRQAISQMLTDFYRWCEVGEGTNAWLNGGGIQPEALIEDKTQGFRETLKENVAAAASCLIATLCSFMKCKSPIGKPMTLVKELIAKLPTLAKDSMSLLTFFSANMSFLSDIVLAVGGSRMGGLWVKNDFNFDEWLREVTILTDPVNRAVIEHDPSLIEAVYKKKMEADELLSRNSGARAGAILKSFQLKLEKVSADLIDECVVSHARYVPMAICLEGEPGVGKSFLVNKIAAELIDHVGIKTKGNVCYSRTMGNKYWQRLRNEPVVVFDDVMVLKGQFEQDQVSEIVQICSTQPFNPPVAEVEGKNKLYNPKLVMMTTNIPFPSIISMREPRAFYRRRNVMVKVSLRSRYKNKKIDSIPEKVLKKNEHLEFSFYQDPSDSKSIVGEPVDYDTFMRLLKGEYAAYHAKECKNYAARYESDFDLDGCEDSLGKLREIVENNHEPGMILNSVRNIVDAPHRVFLQPEAGEEELGAVPRSSQPKIGSWARESDIAPAAKRIGKKTRKKKSCAGAVAAAVAQCIHSPVHKAFFYVSKEEDSDISCDDGEFIYMNQLIPATRCKDNCVMDGWQENEYPHEWHPQRVQLLQEPENQEIQESAGVLRRAAEKVWRSLKTASLGTLCGVLAVGATLLCSAVALVKGYRMLMGRERPAQDDDNEFDVEGALPENGSQERLKGAPKPNRGQRIQRAVERIKFAVPEGGVEETSVDSLLRLIGNNSGWLSFETDEKTVFARFVAICGRNIMVMKHFVESWESYGKPQLFVSIKGTKTRVDFDADQFMSFPHSSMALYNLPNKIPLFRDIRKHVALVRDHDYVSSDGLIVGVARDGKVTYSQRVPVDFSGRVNVDKKEGCDEQTLSASYTYPLSGSGTCGSLLVSTGSMAKIIGIHVAGAVAGRRGFAQILAREMFEHLKATDSVPPPFDDTAETLIQPEDGLIVHGKLEQGLRKKTGSGKTKLKELPTKGEFCEVLKEPSVLSKDDPRIEGKFDPQLEGVRKQACEPKQFPKVILEEAYCSLRDKILATSKPVMASRDELLTDQQIVCGIPGVEGYQRLKMSTSEGFPLVLERPKGKHDKSWLFELEETTEGFRLISIKKELQELSEHNMQLRERGIAPCSIFSSSLKDCLLPKEKVLLRGKTRMFSESPVELTMAFKKYFGHFTASLCAHRIRNEQSVGINPDGPEWGDLYRHLSECSSSALTGDYSSFGDGLESDVLRKALQIALDWYERYYSDSPNFRKNQHLREVLIEEALHCWRLLDDTIYQTFSGIPSGFLMTVEANSLVNGLYMRMCWLSRVTGKLKSLRNFDRYTRFVFYGDDLLGSISEEVSDQFNFKILQDFLKEQGIKFTNESKSDESYIVHPLKEARFLSRAFVPHPKRCGEFLAPLRDISIFPQTDFTWSCNNDRDAALNNCRAALRDAFGRGEEFYEDLRQRMVKYWAGHQVHFQSDHWKYVDESTFE